MAVSVKCTLYDHRLFGLWWRPHLGPHRYTRLSGRGFSSFYLWMKTAFKFSHALHSPRERRVHVVINVQSV